MARLGRLARTFVLTVVLFINCTALGARTRRDGGNVVNDPNRSLNRIAYDRRFLRHRPALGFKGRSDRAGYWGRRS
jgi:hypothetical protein